MVEHCLVNCTFPVHIMGKHFLAQNHRRSVLGSRQLPYFALLQHSSVHAAVEIVVKHDLVQSIFHPKADMKPT